MFGWRRSICCRSNSKACLKACLKAGRYNTPNKFHRISKDFYKTVRSLRLLLRLKTVISYFFTGICLQKNIGSRGSIWRIFLLIAFQSAKLISVSTAFFGIFNSIFVNRCKLETAFWSCFHSLLNIPSLKFQNLHPFNNRSSILGEY